MSSHHNRGLESPSPFCWTSPAPELTITTPHLYMTLPPRPAPISNDKNVNVEKSTAIKLHHVRSSGLPQSFPFIDSIAAIKAECRCPKCASDLHLRARHPVDVSMFFLNGLTRWSHDAWFIADWAAFSFSRISNYPSQLGGTTFRSLSREQSVAIYFWHKFREDPQYGGLACSPRHLAESDPEKELFLPLEIFSKVFFFGQLSSNIVRLRWDNGRECAINEYRQGYTEHFENQTYIYLNPYHPRHRNNATGLLRTLLHEMIHAFIGRYACHNAIQRCRNVHCKTVHHENYGVTGHGRAWQLLAKAIEDHGSKMLPGFNIWLGRIESAVLEVKAGGWRPTDCDIEDLFGREGAKLRKALSLGTKDDDEVAWEMLVRNGDVLRATRKKKSRMPFEAWF